MMASPYLVAIEGATSWAERIKEIDGAIDLQAQMAVNRTIDWARAQASREIRRQVNFSKAYLDGSGTGGQRRLDVTQRASQNDIQAVLTARQRPTSLARFTTATDPGLTRREGGVRVEVKPGSVQFMKRAFLMRLRQGKAFSETQHNLGLAIRLRPGESLNNKLKVQQIKHNLYMLYGPSVDQVFRTVAADIAPDVETKLETEFLRLVGAQIGKR